MKTVRSEIVADDEDEKEPAPARTTSATPPPLDSDPFAITGLDDPPPKSPGAISSGAFEISRASFAPRAPEDMPPREVIGNAMARGKPPLSLSAIAGIGIGVLVVAIALALLLFR